ncbi:hypothetical protein NIIDMKKI_31520 [Mycobacterium kansasii]|uniref:GAF domain-containing protein n=1 Tax=Mycobacterium kansasii TaxID=1768 RepID=A0A7G1IAB1_MYCKA|nr:hypothetical protein NIIDMKKI_31520 [Mycobacterium kansasii]
MEVRTYAGVHALALGLLSDDGNTLHWMHMAGELPPIVTQFADGLPLTQWCAATDAMSTGVPVLIRDEAEYQRRYPETAQWTMAAGIASMGVWPLAIGQSRIGVLELAWSRSQPLDATQRSFASAVASMVTQALIRARAYADEHTRAAVLQAAVLPASPRGRGPGSGGVLSPRGCDSWAGRGLVGRDAAAEEPDLPGGR